MFLHRPVNQSDLPAVCSFTESEEELFHAFPKATYPLTPEQLQRAIEQRADSTVIERDGETQGFANFYRWDAGVCCIGNVMVAPKARGQGVAQYLIQTMIALAAHKYDALETRVSCFNSNPGGLLLYAKLGFQPFAVEERQAPGGCRAALIHMRHVADQPNNSLQPTAPIRRGG